MEFLISTVTGWVPRGLSHFLFVFFLFVDEPEDDYKWTGLAEGLPDAVQKFLDEKAAKSK